MLWSKKLGFCSKTTNHEQFHVLASLTGALTVRYVNETLKF